MPGAGRIISAGWRSSRQARIPDLIRARRAPRDYIGPPNAERCADHDLGWAHYLERLAIAASGRDPGVDPGPVAQEV
jgi:hypothetical protein